MIFLKSLHTDKSPTLDNHAIFEAIWPLLNSFKLSSTDMKLLDKLF